jgi:hypothetical protein
MLTYMTNSAAALLCLLVLSSGLDLRPSELALIASATAQGRPEWSEFDRPVDRLSLGHPFWRRGAGLVYGAMALRNQNDYSVKDLIIGCDFFDEWGNLVNRRATWIPRPFSPGRTWVSGIYLTLPSRNAQAGACQIISAKRVPAVPVF